MSKNSVAEKQQVAHTPGPWKVWQDDESGDFHVLTADDAMSICEMDPDNPSEDVSLADACLIAAAPSMHRELGLAADTFRDMSNVLAAIGKDTMSAAAAIAERHIRECLAAISEGREA